MTKLERLEAHRNRAERKAGKAWTRMNRAETRYKKVMEVAAKAESRFVDLKAAAIKARMAEEIAEDAYNAEFRRLSDRARDPGDIGRPGDAAATLHEETGIDYARCLVMCNCD